MASVLRVEMGWSGGMRELAFIARRRFQERKEGIWETDSIGGSKGKKSVAGVEKKKTLPDKRDHGVSDTQRGKESAARELGCAREKGERASWWAAGPKTEKRSKFLFLFPFQIFQSIFK
jgi:hypothetical protein